MTYIQDWQHAIGADPDGQFGPETLRRSLALLPAQTADATTVSQAGIDLIKEFEGLRLDAYQDSVGVWTIGYGTTAAAGVGIVPKAGQHITQAEAEGYLKRAVAIFAESIRDKLTHSATPNQFAAMVSLAYNIGPGAFASSTLLKKFNAGDIAGAAAAFASWNLAGGKVLPGLTRRRAAEAALFSKGDA